MKKIILLPFFLVLFFNNVSNGFTPEKYIINCELKDGLFESSFTNFDKKDIKRFKNKILSLKIDTTSKIVMSNNDNLEILHGILESEKLISYEELRINQYGKEDWEKSWKKYEDLHLNELFWISELVIEEDPVVKYKYEGKIKSGNLKIIIIEWSTREIMGTKSIYPKNLQNPYTLTPKCKWKPFT